MLMKSLNIKSIKGAYIGLLLVLAASAMASGWKELAEDGIHDPDNPALQLLQYPGESLSVLPPDSSGNKVDWVRALQNKEIQPRSYIKKETEEEILDLDVLIVTAGSVPLVMFPHKAHTEWLDCSNCHEQPFKTKAGATKFTMLEILNGEYCGVCHGAVSFPLTECNRCHSVSRDEALEFLKKAKADESD